MCAMKESTSQAGNSLGFALCCEFILLKEASMNRKAKFLPLFILMLSFMLSACIGLLPLEDEPVTGEFGPQTSLQEQQTRTFETMWKHFEENYIYFETAEVNWSALRDQYLERVNSGLTADEFNALIEDLQAELPEGSLSYQSRQE